MIERNKESIPQSAVPTITVITAINKVVCTVSLRVGHTTFLSSFRDSCRNVINDFPLVVVNAINKVKSETTTTAIIRTIAFG